MSSSPSSRRRFLRLAAFGAGSVLAAPGLVLARAATERRFVFVIQRGAADGLDIVAPYGEPAYARLRGALAIDVAAATRLDGLFALHPALVETAKLYDSEAGALRPRGRFAVSRALALRRPERARDRRRRAARRQGRLAEPAGRPAAAPQRRGDRDRADRAAGVARAAPTSSRMRRRRCGRRPTISCSASSSSTPTTRSCMRLWSTAMDARGWRRHVAAPEPGRSRPPRGELPGARRRPAHRRCSRANGWDTHSAQAPRMTNRLKSLDAMLAALRDGLGAAWAETTVLVATEFGRTAAANGTGGTDHGTASAAMLLGGGVDGGRVRVGLARPRAVGALPGARPAADDRARCAHRVGRRRSASASSRNASRAPCSRRSRPARPLPRLLRA